MNPSNAQTSMQVYASDNDQYKSSPTEDQIRAGVVPLDTLPAAWWNYYWSMVTSNNNASKLAIDNIRAEIINVLTAAGVTPTADQTNQLLNSILAIHRKAPYFEATGDAVAGSVISSSDIKSISVNSETGKVTVNALADWEGTDTIKGRVSAIEAVVPSTASASNKLATEGDIPDISALESSVSGIEAVMPYKIDRVRYNLANTDFPNGLVGCDIATWLNARATDSVFRKPGIHIVELYNTATANYGYFFIQNLGPQGADTVADYGVAEFKTYYTAGGRPFYFLLKQSTWSLMHDANNVYLETSDLTSTVSSGRTAPITSGGVYSALNTVNYGTATRNSATMTGESFVGKWHKCGKLVMAEVQGNTVASGITPESNLMTGFPKPLENVALVAQGRTNAATVGIVLKTDGALKSHYNVSASTFFHATFTYIAAE